MPMKTKRESIEESNLPFGGGVIMPHVVSPEMTGGEVTTPRILHLHPDLEAQADESAGDAQAQMKK